MRLRDGLCRLELPSRLPIGTVNVYVFTDEPVTLIDTGPNCPECHDELVRQIRDLRLSTADVERILLTHGHVDHHGLAETIRRESGAEVIVPEADRGMVEAYRETFMERREYYREEALRAGAPAATVELVIDYFEYLISLGEPTKVAGSVKDGDRIWAGTTELRAVHTPGHSSGSTCYLSARGELFGGDTLLRDMTPNAAFGGADRQSVGLADYIASLHRVRALKPRVVHAGHRTSLENVDAYVRYSLNQYRVRSEAILRLLHAGPASPFELVTRLFGTLPIEEILLGITEVLGHLEVLAREGVVAVEPKGEVNVARLK